MRDILDPGHQPEEPDPIKRAQAAMARQVLPKRFYAEVTVERREAGFTVLLDGRQARTPGRNLLALATEAAAERIAAEWRAQEKVIDPALMHATRMANTGIDSVGQRLAEVQQDIAGYAASDLVCYRAGDPEGLAAQQNKRWNPVVDWARDALGARMALTEGVMHVAQSPEALAAVGAAVAAVRQPVKLAALHVATTMAGSCLIALMLAAGALAADDAWAAANADEDWNAHLWGRDAEAEARAAQRREEFIAAADLLAAL